MARSSSSAPTWPVSTEGELPPLPFLAMFQGDGYALAAIAGPGAGTDADAAVPGLAG